LTNIPRSQAPVWERPSPELSAWLPLPQAGKLEALQSGVTKRELGHEGDEGDEVNGDNE